MEILEIFKDIITCVESTVPAVLTGTAQVIHMCAENEVLSVFMGLGILEMVFGIIGKLNHSR